MPALPMDKLLYLIQFAHPEKVFARLPGMGEETAAMAFGLQLPELRELKARFAQAARAAAEELLSEPGFSVRVERLPFPRGTVVAGVGDSVTDDLQSWFEILRHLMALCRPADEIALLNAGVSGDTTTHCIARFAKVVAAKPSWVLCLIGTNDARLHGLSPTKTLVSATETRANLRMLRNYGATGATSEWLWITAPGVIEEKIKTHWFLSAMQVAYRNSDVASVAEIIREQPDPCVDIHRLVGFPEKASLLLDDGLHPSLAGHKAIARAVVQHLAR